MTEATIGKWFKKAGDAVAVDEPLVELETDKVTIEVPAPAAGVLTEVAAEDGETVAVGTLLGAIKEGPGAVRPARSEDRAGEADRRRAQQPKPRDAAPAAAALQKPAAAPAADMPLAPSVRKIAAEDRDRCRDRAGSSSGSMRRSPGRHARRDRAGSGAADACCAAGRGDPRAGAVAARRRRPVAAGANAPSAMRLAATAKHSVWAGVIPR